MLPIFFLIMIVRLPENELLDLIRKTNKGDLHMNDTHVFESHFDNFKHKTNFDKDSSYKFIKACFQKIITKKIKLLDIGCYVGPLPIFLKKNKFWDLVDYSGTDIIPNALEIAKSNFPEGNYFVANAESLKTEEYYDIVFSKGTIISTFYPDKALNSILDIPSKYVLLAHQPLIKSTPKNGKRFESILVVNDTNMYTSTVLYYSYFLEELKKRNIKVVKMRRRFLPTRVGNFTSYYLYDFLLEKPNNG